MVNRGIFMWLSPDLKKGIQFLRCLGCLDAQVRPFGSRCKTSPTLPAIQAIRAEWMTSLEFSEWEIH